MKMKLQMEPEQVLEHAVAAVKFARQFCDDVEFSPEDAGRSEPDFLCRVIEAVIDATHPFAAAMSRNAAEACAQVQVPLLALRRPPWVPQEGDRWIEVASMEEAVRALGDIPRRVFLTVGRLELPPFAAAPQHTFLVRTIEPIGEALPVPHVIAIRDRAPFDEAAERALMERERVEVVVTKNSGGAATYPKIAAARALGLPVIVVARPEKPRGVEEVATADAAFDWLERRHGRTP